MKERFRNFVRWLRIQIEQIDTWCGSHEGFVRFIEVGFVAAAGIALALGGLTVAYFQMRIDERSLVQYQKANELTAASLELTAENLKLVQIQAKLAEKQTRLAEREFFPDFRFARESGPTASILVTDANKRIRSLDGKAKLYFELTDREGQIRRIEVRNFFQYWHSRPKQLSEPLGFYHYAGLEDIHSPIRFDRADKVDYELIGKLVDEWRKMQVHCFVFAELDFFDAANEHRTECYRVLFPHANSMPISAEPTYDDFIDVNTYIPTKEIASEKDKRNEAIIAMQKDVFAKVEKMYNGEK